MERLYKYEFRVHSLGENGNKEPVMVVTVSETDRLRWCVVGWEWRGGGHRHSPFVHKSNGLEVGQQRAWHGFQINFKSESTFSPGEG